MKHKYPNLTIGVANRMNKGDPVFVRTQFMPNYEKATFVSFDSKSGIVTLEPACHSQQPLSNVFSVVRNPFNHLPDKYEIWNAFAMMPKAKYDLECIMPSLCQHCGPAAKCENCSVRRTFTALNNLYNRYFDACAQGMPGAYWVDDPIEPRTPYNKNSPAITQEEKNELIRACCTFCPGRQITKTESYETDLEVGGLGTLPGVACKHCPLYKKAIKPL